MTTARVGRENRLIRDPDNDGAYWKLAGVKAGRYYVGVWYESGKAGAEAPQNRFGALCVYLNGRLLQLATTSDPLQVAPGVYFAEAQTGQSADIRPGDEIAVLPESIRRMRVARLTLYPTRTGTRPRLGPGKLRGHLVQSRHGPAAEPGRHVRRTSPRRLPPGRGPGAARRSEESGRRRPVPWPPAASAIPCPCR